ncbi:DUF3841 domain-containing protein [Dorea acetigenes]|uniref:DUF3841 domain-containing protein n=1 Tax=Dorea acetigenes TaxID=2981787 RepID=A0ABT2RRA9_9FIRM|nr:DUF3841 domain-containing protein [Dorea acetigenes]MCU6687905.1 DUF3841 domain-containing protein [Dorea acetigenes]SCJ60145.1 Domain of uncharacterised function (DUF3841) [uncultured Clostridium sp.]
MEGKVVRLYTRQNDKTLYQLKRDGRIINQRVYVEMHFGDIAPLFMESYDWFTKEAAKIVPKPEDVHAPIWCSISVENCLKPIEGTVVYELEVPEERVIYFDEAKWDYVLNRIYLPKDAKDGERYKKYLKDIGVVNGFEFFQGRYKGMYPEEEERIMDSWQRVFEIDNWTIFNVCGNLWEIRQEWVKRIVYPGEKL